MTEQMAMLKVKDIVDANNFIGMAKIVREKRSHREK